MAGGIGSRFWPASRASRPKQFLDILGTGKSLIRMTFERFRQLCPANHIFVVTNGQYRDLVREHLPEIADNQILCEPSRNNTGPCVAYTAFKLHDIDPQANLIVAPSDHLILEENNFLNTLREGLAFTANHNALLTLGIEPTRPDTGYGYIHFDPAAAEEETEGGVQTGVQSVHKVLQFTEKPPLEKAKEYLASGEYLWNAGIFVWRVDNLLQAFRQHAPEIYDILGKGAYNCSEEQAFIDQAYPTTPSISVDYAIMEKADNVYTIPSNFGWSDLGTWASLHAVSEKDDRRNVLQGERILAQNIHNCLVRVPKDKLVVLKDLEDYIVVDEGDILLVYPKSKEQEIKQLTKKLP